MIDRAVPEQAVGLLEMHGRKALVGKGRHISLPWRYQPPVPGGRLGWWEYHRRWRCWPAFRARGGAGTMSCRMLSQDRGGGCERGLDAASLGAADPVAGVAGSG